MNKINDVIEGKIIDNSKIEIIEKKYGDIPEKIKKIISTMEDDSIFFDNIRLIALSELLMSSEIYNSDIEKKKIILLFDCKDNDFIAFDNINKKYVMFNIVDNVVFNEKDDIEELLKNV